MRPILSAEHLNPKALEAIKRMHPKVVQEAQDAIQKHEWVVIGMAQNPVSYTHLTLPTKA